MDSIDSSSDWTTGTPQLLARRCRNGHRWYLPKFSCPHCGTTAELFEPSRSGTIFTRTTVHRHGNKGEAISIALVDLDDGVRIMARCAAEAKIRDRVEIEFIAGDDDGSLLPSCRTTKPALD